MGAGHSLPQTHTQHSMENGAEEGLEVRDGHGTVGSLGGGRGSCGGWGESGLGSLEKSSACGAVGGLRRGDTARVSPSSLDWPLGGSGCLVEMRKPGGVVRELLGADGSWAAGHRSGRRTGLGSCRGLGVREPPGKASPLGGRAVTRGERAQGSRRRSWQ